jgi:hypothetical protein
MRTKRPRFDLHDPLQSFAAPSSAPETRHSVSQRLEAGFRPVARKRMRESFGSRVGALFSLFREVIRVACVESDSIAIRIDQLKIIVAEKLVLSNRIHRQSPFN